MYKYLLVIITVLFAITNGAVISNLKKLPKLNGRIVGGNIVAIDKHPHQISLGYRSCSTCFYSHTCGGSIYNDLSIITAAHCVYNRPITNFMVVAGTDNRNGLDGVITRVKKVVIHEKYNASNTDYDVALCILETPLPINNVTIATIALADKKPESGAKSIVTGWGAIDDGGAASEKLLEVEVPIVSNDECKAAYGKGRITDSMICAGIPNGGKDACHGDSGGPLLVNGRLTGIVSWGRGCARPGFPGVYANVSFLKDWIEKNIRRNMKKAKMLKVLN